MAAQEPQKLLVTVLVIIAWWVLLLHREAVTLRLPVALKRAEKLAAL